MSEIKTITRMKNGRLETYKGYVYRNHGGSWTGWINLVFCGGCWKFTSRSGYETKEKAEAYVSRWLDKLKKERRVMTKLEELKALMEVAQSQIRTSVTSREYDNLYQGRKSARYKLELMAMYMLPDLIAVAESAGKVCCHDFSVSDLDGDLMLDMRHLENALLPLTKDADK